MSDGSSVRIAVVQLGPVGEDKTANIRLVQEKVEEILKGQNGGAPIEMLVLPECWNSPYSTAYFRENAEVIPSVGSTEHDLRDSVSVLAMQNMARRAKCWLIGGSIPELDPQDDKVYNTSIVFDPQGHLVAKHRKIHLIEFAIPNGPRLVEPDVLTPGKTMTSFDTPRGPVALAICYDVRFPELSMIAARRGCWLMIYPFFFSETTGSKTGDTLFRARAIDNQIFVVACSTSRNADAPFQAWGHSMVIDPSGTVLEQLEERPGHAVVDLDLGSVDQARKQLPLARQRRFDVYPDVSA